MCTTTITANFKTFSSPQKETQYNLAITTPLTATLPIPKQTLIYFVFTDFLILDISYE